jgi:trans-aconitate methyltransferase
MGLTKQKPAAWYNENSDRAMLPLHESPWLPLYKAIIELLPIATGYLYDLGCGTGRFARLYDEVIGGDYLGVDFADALIAEAEAYNPDMAFLCANILECGELLQDADTVVISEVLEHIDDDMAVLGLIPSGTKIVLSLPNFDSESHVRVFSNYGDVKARYQHLIQFEDAKRVKLSAVKWWTVCRGVKL